MSVSTVGRSLGVFLVVAGIGHFLFPRSVDALVPHFLPGTPRTWTYLSGIAELTIGIASLTPLSLKIGNTSLRLLAAYAALLLFVAVFPANIQMAIDWRHRPFPSPLLAYLRLPLQFGLFYWAWSIIKALRR